MLCVSIVSFGRCLTVRFARRRTCKSSSCRACFCVLLLLCVPPVSGGGLDILLDLKSLVERDGVCALPGCPMKFDRFFSMVHRAMSRGYIKDHVGHYVLNGFTNGFDLGARLETLKGQRVFQNYPTAVAARDSVSNAIESRVHRSKSICLGLWDALEAQLRSSFPDFFIFPMGAVPKPHKPDVMRPTSDHTRTGFNAATVLGILGHSLDAYRQLEHLFHRNAFMTVSDVEDAFSYIPLAPALWMFMLFRWFNSRASLTRLPNAAKNRLHLYAHLFADFGSKGAPGTMYIILVQVFVGIAKSEFVLTLPIVIYVDDVAVIGAAESEANAELEAFQTFTTEHFGLLWALAKRLFAAVRQLYIGFWWDSRYLTRSLPEAKLLSYLDVLLGASLRTVITLRERQSLAGKMQRAIMTFPPGAACLLVNCYKLMCGLSLPWHSTRTTRAERHDYRFVHDLLQLNMGKGYYSYDGFLLGPDVRSDASKSKAYAGGGYCCADGPYDFWVYGSSAKRKCIDYLEGETMVRACVAEGPAWRGKQIPFGLDNSSMELSIEAGRSRAPRLNDLLRALFVLQIKHGFVLLPYWLGTKENYLADYLSRDREDLFLEHAGDFLYDGIVPARRELAGRKVTLADNDYNDAMRALRQLLGTYSSNPDLDGAPSFAVLLFFRLMNLFWACFNRPLRHLWSLFDRPRFIFAFMRFSSSSSSFNVIGMWLAKCWCGCWVGPSAEVIVSSTW